MYSPSGKRPASRYPSMEQSEQGRAAAVDHLARDDDAISEADIAKYGAEFLVPYDTDKPGPLFDETDLPLYNPNCWPVEWMADMAARGEDLTNKSIRVPHHPDAAPDSPFILEFAAATYAITCQDAHRLHADFARIRDPLPLVPAQRNKFVRAARSGRGRTSSSSAGHEQAARGDPGFVVDSDGDVVMGEETRPPPVREIERHSVDSFRVELAKDPSAKITLASPPPPQHLLPPRSFTYHSGLIFSATCPPPDPAFLLGCDCTSTRPCILPSGRVNPACHHGDEAYGHSTAPTYTSDGRLRALVQLQNSTFLPVTSPFVIECNVNCACARFAPSASASAGSMCKNRVAQHGIRYRLVIGHASGKGLGVFAAERIPQGAFVVEYAGEVLTQDELRARDEEWMAKVGGGEGRVISTTTYSFNADWMVDGSNDEEMAKVKAIEARYKGNCSRFFNHSCSPNLIVGAIQYDMDDPYLHRIGFFALRDIVAGEELAFDYHGGEKSIEQDQGEGGRGSRRSAAPKVGRKRTTRRRGGSTASVREVEEEDEGADKLTGLYKFRCLCGSEKCRGNVL